VVSQRCIAVYTNQDWHFCHNYECHKIFLDDNIPLPHNHLFLVESFWFHKWLLYRYAAAAIPKSSVHREIRSAASVPPVTGVLHKLVLQHDTVYVTYALLYELAKVLCVEQNDRTAQP
jgi:hypothetical protein